MKYWGPLRGPLWGPLGGHCGGHWGATIVNRIRLYLFEDWVQTCVAFANERATGRADERKADERVTH